MGFPSLRRGFGAHLEQNDMKNKNAFGGRVFDILASLRLAVTVMLTLGLTCLTATIYESKHGTAAVQREFYKTRWFALILATLGVNIFCAMMKRYPWKKGHIGFVMAHCGILSLLAGSLISLHFGLDSNMALYEGETTDRVALVDRALHVELPGGGIGSFPVDFESHPPGEGREQRFKVPGGDVSLVAEAFYPHVKVGEDFEEAPSGEPALHFVLDNPFVKEKAWILASGGEQSHLNFGPASVDFRKAPSEAFLPSPTGGNEVSFLLRPSGKLSYAFQTKTGVRPGGRVELGTPIETPWMGMKVIVDRFLPRAASHRSVESAPPPEKEERLMPAVRVHLEGPAGLSASEWLLWTESRAVPFGGAQARLAYRSPEAGVPFRVTLLKFNSDKYPGSNMAATYESWVRVEDPERGVSEHHISMNHPLHYRGYVFFQASFVEGQPMMSIFSVARAPGLPLVYVGVVLIASGVVWMFYLKPYLARRQGMRALQAKELRESHNEKGGGVDPATGCNGRAEPASSGA